MTDPTHDQVAALMASLETFTRRYKVKDLGSEKPLTELDTQTLFYLRAHPDCGPSDVARHFDVAMTTISSATDRLAKRQLIERHRPEGDRRAVALRLTSAGETYVAAQEQAYHNMFRSMLGKLTNDERDSFIRIMAKIAHSDD